MVNSVGGGTGITGPHEVYAESLSIKQRQASVFQVN